MKEIEKKAEKDVMIKFFQNKYCTIHEIERELEKYPEDFVVGEEPTWWVMGSSKTEPPRKTERQQKSAPSSGQRSQTAGGSVPQPGAPSVGSQASDAVKIDNEIIDSIFRMNSGGDDDRWMIINPTAGHVILCWEGECGMATAVCFLVCPNRMLVYWTPSGRQSHQRVDPGGEEPGQRTWTVEPDYQEAEQGPHWRGDGPRHDDPQEELLGPGLAPEGRQLEREHEDLPDDGQRTGMDKHRGEIILWVE